MTPLGAVLMLAVAADGGVMTDAVRDLVRRELGTLDGGVERVEPDTVSFTNPADPRFVTVDLTVVPVAPKGGWEVRATHFAGFHELRVQVDRKHLRLMQTPGLMARIAQPLATRAAAIERAKKVSPCAAPLWVEATRIFASGRRDFWRFVVACSADDATTIEVEDDGHTTRVR
jgi:hypothetical protein